METNLKQLKCGECSNDKHLLYQRKNGEMIAECSKCKSQTEIITTKPKIILNNIFGDGSLCIFE